MEYTLLTGACGGLGGAFAELLAERGEALLLTGRSEERLSALEERLHSRHEGLNVLSIACDLRSEEGRRAFFAEADRLGIRFHRLVYAAGVDTQMAFERYDEGRIVTQARVNFEGAVSLFHGVIARSSLDGTTELLAVGSVSGVFPMPYFALYSATKKALEQFCSALRVELKGKAKVTCVLPGSMPTREDLRAYIASHGPVGRMTVKSPQSVARAALKAVARNRRKKTVGGCNRLVLFFSRLAPFPIRMRIIARMWKRTEKDHFAE